MGSSLLSVILLGVMICVYDENGDQSLWEVHLFQIECDSAAVEIVAKISRLISGRPNCEDPLIYCYWVRGCKFFFSDTCESLQWSTVLATLL